MLKGGNSNQGDQGGSGQGDAGLAGGWPSTTSSGVGRSNIAISQADVEDDGNEIKRAKSIRKASRKKMWYIFGFILFLVIVLGIICYIMRCQFFSVHFADWDMPLMPHSHS